MLQVTFPFEQFLDTSGNPLDNGYVYIGTANQNPETNPIAVYWDDALTIPAAQPIRTINGYLSRNGSPARLYTSPNIFSITVRDKTQAFIASALDVSSLDSLRTDLAASSGASLVGYLPAGTGAVATTIQRKNREIKSLLDFMIDDLKDVVAAGVYTAQDRLDMYTACNKAWTAALAASHDLYAPAGLYEIGESSFPWRQAVVATLLDCNNVTLYCDGPATVFATNSVNGADVFQLNGLKNFHVKGFPTLTSTISGSTAGSNGCSITNGYDNLTLEISPYNCAFIDKTTYIDGGKGLSIQTPTAGQTLECGTLVARVMARGCVYGFGLELDLVASMTKKTSIDIDLVAEDCRQGVVFSAGAASAALTKDMSSGLKVRATTINCMNDVAIGRAHGIDVECKVVTTKTAAARILSYTGAKWFAADTVAEVGALTVAYAHNANAKVTGNKGACGYKAQIGGAAAGSSGLPAASYLSDFDLDITGTSTTGDFAAIDSGGNVASNCSFRFSEAFTTGIGTELQLTSRNNRILYSAGASITFGNMRFPAVQAPSTDPNTLDDYEEGSFTPVLADFGLAAEGATYSIQTGEYTKIGNKVDFSLTLALTGLGTLTGTDSAFVIGMPYASKAARLFAFNVSFTSGLNMAAAAFLQARMAGGVSYIELRKTAFTSTSGDAAMTINEVSIDGVFVVSGTYFTAT
jgi:hypothetical protein